MSPVRSLQSATVGMFFDELSSKIAMLGVPLGAVDEVDQMQNKERSNSNEL